MSMSERPPYRLPHTVVPSRYQLEITPDLNQGTFHGIALIDIKVRESISEMVLNALNLTLNTVRFKDGNGSDISGSVSYNASEEQVTLHWPKPLATGDGVLEIHYDGVLGNDLRGFYRTTVQGPDGDSMIIASTHCEATDARQIFPGWDEPEFKAVFGVTLMVDADLVALSNAREVSNAIDNQGKRRVTFADTIPMSTYLVALVVGPLALGDSQWVGKTPVRIAARPSLSHLAEVAEEAAVDTLRFFEEYFGIPYPGDKMDHVAVPDFAAGAMENLGCVIYREELLLIDRERSSPMERANVVATIAHETAHMWFGDLVTMRWWNGIWLNEAFATFMQLLATDALHPEWDIWTIFSHGRGYALHVDGLVSTRPIEYPVGRPVESWGMFDVLTYQKGGAVLRMLEQFLGPDVFRQGIRQYLEKHRYHNTETSDLWDALEAASDQPVRSIMDSWVFQEGYPLITATLSTDQRTVTLTQRQFRYRGDGTGQWQVPITVGIRRSTGEQETVRLLLGESPIEIPVPADMVALLANQGGWGFYRVAYDQNLWQRLVTHFSWLTPIERYGLVDDVWAAVEADALPLSHAIALWRMMTEEEDPDVWGAVTPGLSLLHRISDASSRPALQSLIQDIAGPMFRKLGWEPGSHEDVRLGRLRALLMQLLGTTGGDAGVREEARRRWLSHVQGQEQAPAELLTALAAVAAVAGGSREWELMYHQFKNPTNPQEESRYLDALARFTKPEEIHRTLEVYQSSEVRVQDGAFAMGQLLSNSDAERLAWESIEVNWDRMLQKYPHAMVQYYTQPIATIVDDALADRTVAWLDAHPVEEVARFTRQTKETQGINRALAQRIKEHLAEWLG